jgi:hypothetical protein
MAGLLPIQSSDPANKSTHKQTLFLRLCTKPKLGLTPIGIEHKIGADGLESNLGTKLN